MRRRDISALLLAGAAARASAATPLTAARDTPSSGPQTTAEALGDVRPYQPGFTEGDIRRYGAAADSPDNSAAINAALWVSTNGGTAAFIPAGRWKITSPLRAMHDSSMHGIGNASVIVPQACDGLIFGPADNYPVNGLSRFFRDFQIVGSNPVDPPHRAIVIDFSSHSQNRVVGVVFENLYIANFGTGVYLRGLWFGNFLGCHFYKCHRGVQFVGESVATSILNCNFNRGDIKGTSEAWGISLDSIDGESTQSTRVISTHVYLYDILINVILALELQIEHCDLSAAQSIGVQIVTTMGGCWVRDCWIETANPSATVGVKVADVQPSTYARVHIVGNYLTCDTPRGGSQGIYVGGGNSSIAVNDNAIIGFDQALTLGACANLSCKNNRVSCVTPAYSASSHAVMLNSSATDSEIGPNEIIHGKVQTAHMTAGQADIRVADKKLFGVGTPVRFDADVNGFRRTATYFVLDSASNVLRVGAVPNGLPIASTGDAPISVCLAPLPLTFTATTPRGLCFFGRGAFMTNLSGFSKVVCGLMSWSANGHLVILDPGTEPLTGPSSSAQLSANGLPAFLRPATAQSFCVNVQDSGASSLGFARLSTLGDLALFKGPNLEAFSTSGTKGINAQAMIYSLG
jgi:hypothetical protein